MLILCSAAPVGNSRWLVRLFFMVLLLLGVLEHRDYGMSWDEENNHLNGLVGLKYIAQVIAPDFAKRQAIDHPWIPELRKFPDSDHGAAFEMLVAVLGYGLTNGDAQEVYYLRHLCVFLTFSFGVWALYRIGQMRFQDWRWGLLTASLLVLSPRFFAEAFYNGKDVVYMALFTVSIYTLLRFVRRPLLAETALHGLATAAVASIRVQGLQVVLFTMLLVLLVNTRQKLAPRRLLFLLTNYLLVTGTFLFIGWPYLWATSFTELLAALPRSSYYPWPFLNLYWGKFLSVKQLPWHYVPIWILITTPLPYVASSLVGTFASLRDRWNGKQHRWHFHLDLVILLWLFAPIAIVVFFQIVIYEGWRHLYYTYPALLLMAVRGIREICQASKQATRWRPLWLGILLLMALETAHTAVRMVQIHPNQQVYFSFLPASTAERLFERDYWGLSYRQGLEWILAHDSAPTIKVSVAWHTPLYNNSLILSPAQRARLQYVPRTEPGCHYFLTAYRWHPQSYLDSLGTEVYTVRAGQLKVLSVFDCRNTHYYQQTK